MWNSGWDPKTKMISVMAVEDGSRIAGKGLGSSQDQLPFSAINRPRRLIKRALRGTEKALETRAEGKEKARWRTSAVPSS